MVYEDDSDDSFEEEIRHVFCDTCWSFILDDYSDEEDGGRRSSPTNRRRRLRKLRMKKRSSIYDEEPEQESKELMDYFYGGKGGGGNEDTVLLDSIKEDDEEEEDDDSDDPLSRRRRRLKKNSNKKHRKKKAPPKPDYDSGGSFDENNDKGAKLFDAIEEGDEGDGGDDITRDASPKEASPRKWQWSLWASHAPSGGDKSAGGNELDDRDENQGEERGNDSDGNVEVTGDIQISSSKDHVKDKIEARREEVDDTEDRESDRWPVFVEEKNEDENTQTNQPLDRNLLALVSDALNSKDEGNEGLQVHVYDDHHIDEYKNQGQQPQQQQDPTPIQLHMPEVTLGKDGEISVKSWSNKSIHSGSQKSSLHPGSFRSTRTDSKNSVRRSSKSDTSKLSTDGTSQATSSQDDNVHDWNSTVAQMSNKSGNGLQVFNFASPEAKTPAQEWDSTIAHPDPSLKIADLQGLSPTVVEESTTIDQPVAAPMVEDSVMMEQPPVENFDRHALETKEEKAKRRREKKKKRKEKRRNMTEEEKQERRERRRRREEKANRLSSQTDSIKTDVVVTDYTNRLDQPLLQHDMAMAMAMTPAAPPPRSPRRRKDIPAKPKPVREEPMESKEFINWWKNSEGGANVDDHKSARHLDRKQHMTSPPSSPSLMNDTVTQVNLAASKSGSPIMGHNTKASPSTEGIASQPIDVRHMELPRDGLPGGSKAPPASSNNRAYLSNKLKDEAIMLLENEEQERAEMLQESQKKSKKGSNNKMSPTSEMDVAGVVPLMSSPGSHSTFSGARHQQQQRQQQQHRDINSQETNIEAKSFPNSDPFSGSEDIQKIAVSSKYDLTKYDDPVEAISAADERLAARELHSVRERKVEKQKKQTRSRVTAERNDNKRDSIDSPGRKRYAQMDVGGNNKNNNTSPGQSNYTRYPEPQSPACHVRSIQRNIDRDEMFDSQMDEAVLSSRNNHQNRHLLKATKLGNIQDSAVYNDLSPVRNKQNQSPSRRHKVDQMSSPHNSVVLNYGKGSPGRQLSPGRARSPGQQSVTAAAIRTTTSQQYGKLQESNRSPGVSVNTTRTGQQYQDPVVAARNRSPAREYIDNKLSDIASHYGDSMAQRSRSPGGTSVRARAISPGKTSEQGQYHDAIAASRQRSPDRDRSPGKASVASSLPYGEASERSRSPSTTVHTTNLSPRKRSDHDAISAARNRSPGKRYDDRTHNSSSPGRHRTVDRSRVQGQGQSQGQSQIIRSEHSHHDRAAVTTSSSSRKRSPGKRRNQPARNNNSSPARNRSPGKRSGGLIRHGPSPARTRSPGKRATELSSHVNEASPGRTRSPGKIHDSSAFDAMSANRSQFLASSPPRTENNMNETRDINLSSRNQSPGKGVDQAQFNDSRGGIESSTRTHLRSYRQGAIEHRNSPRNRSPGNRLQQSHFQSLDASPQSKSPDKAAPSRANINSTNDITNNTHRRHQTPERRFDNTFGGSDLKIYKPLPKHGFLSQGTKHEIRGIETTGVNKTSKSAHDRSLFGRDMMREAQNGKTLSEHDRSSKKELPSSASRSRTDKKDKLVKEAREPADELMVSSETTKMKRGPKTKSRRDGEFDPSASVRKNRRRAIARNEAEVETSTLTSSSSPNKTTLPASVQLEISSRVSRQQSEKLASGDSSTWSMRSSRSSRLGGSGQSQDHL